jgi:hypothetical protein
LGYCIGVGEGILVAAYHRLVLTHGVASYAAPQHTLTQHGTDSGHGVRAAMAHRRQL